MDKSFERLVKFLKINFLLIAFLCFVFADSFLGSYCVGKISTNHEQDPLAWYFMLFFGIPSFFIGLFLVFVFLLVFLIGLFLIKPLFGQTTACYINAIVQEISQFFKMITERIILKHFFWLQILIFCGFTLLASYLIIKEFLH